MPRPFPLAAASAASAASVLAAACLVAACAGPAPRRAVPEAGALAAAYAEAGRLDDAVREVEIAVRIHPADAGLRRQAAGLHARGGSLSRAADHLERAVRIAPSDPAAWSALGRVQSRRGRYGAAYVAFKRAAELAPGDAAAAGDLAAAAVLAGLPEQAEAARERWRALDADPAPGSAPERPHVRPARP